MRNMYVFEVRYEGKDEPVRRQVNADSFSEALEWVENFGDQVVTEINLLMVFDQNGIRTYDRDK